MAKDNLVVVCNKVGTRNDCIGCMHSIPHNKYASDEAGCSHWCRCWDADGNDYIKVRCTKVKDPKNG